MKRKQYTRQTARQHKPQRETQAKIRKAMIDEIAEDKYRVALINAKLASAYALMSIATLYVDDDGKRKLMEDINELREMLDKYFGFEEDEPCENEK